jgi:hypothetical protein
MSIAEGTITLPVNGTRHDSPRLHRGDGVFMVSGRHIDLHRKFRTENL